MSVSGKIWPGLMYFWALLILFVSVIPGEALPSISIWEPDKVMHATVYGILTFLLFRTIKIRSLTYSLKKSALTAFILCIFYGFIIELIQLMLPDRKFDLFDALANSIGCFITLACILIFSAPRQSAKLNSRH